MMLTTEDTLLSYDIQEYAHTLDKIAAMDAYGASGFGFDAHTAAAASMIQQEHHSRLPAAAFHNGGHSSGGVQVVPNTNGHSYHSTVVGGGTIPRPKKAPKPKPKKESRFVKTIQCPMPGCDRKYSNDGSLRNHLRLQHPERQLLGPQAPGRNRAPLTAAEEAGLQAAVELLQQPRDRLRDGNWPGSAPVTAHSTPTKLFAGEGTPGMLHSPASVGALGTPTQDVGYDSDGLGVFTHRRQTIAEMGTVRSAQALMSAALAAPAIHDHNNGIVGGSGSPLTGYRHNSSPYARGGYEDAADSGVDYLSSEGSLNGSPLTGRGGHIRGSPRVRDAYTGSPLSTPPSDRRLQGLSAGRHGSANMESLAISLLADQLVQESLTAQRASSDGGDAAQYADATLPNTQNILAQAQTLAAARLSAHMNANASAAGAANNASPLSLRKFTILRERLRQRMREGGDPAQPYLDAPDAGAIPRRWSFGDFERADLAGAQDSGNGPTVIPFHKRHDLRSFHTEPVGSAAAAGVEQTHDATGRWVAQHQEQGFGQGVNNDHHQQQQRVSAVGSLLTNDLAAAVNDLHVSSPQQQFAGGPATSTPHRQSVPAAGSMGNMYSSSPLAGRQQQPQHQRLSTGPSHGDIAQFMLQLRQQQSDAAEGQLAQPQPAQYTQTSPQLGSMHSDSSRAAHAQLHMAQNGAAAGKGELATGSSDMSSLIHAAMQAARISPGVGSGY